jgi:hypothetical protein
VGTTAGAGDALKGAAPNGTVPEGLAGGWLGAESVADGAAADAAGEGAGGGNTDAAADDAAGVGADMATAGLVPAGVYGRCGVGRDGRDPAAATAPNDAGVTEIGSEPPAMAITPPHTEQRARTPVAGTFAGSTRKTDRQSGQETVIAPALRSGARSDHAAVPRSSR